MSKSIPAAKSQNFVDTKGHKNPSGQNFLNLKFFYLKKTRLCILPGKNIKFAHIIFIHKSYNEIVDKIVN